MTRLQLSSKTRTDFRKGVTKKMRTEGRIPATIYGRGADAVSIEIEAEKLAEILKVPGGRHTLIDLEVDGVGEKAHPVLIQVLQRDAITKKVIHVDFHRVSMNENVSASVPLVLVGDSPGVKLGGILEQITTQLDVKGLPDHIPTHLDVDISGLEMGQSIHVGEVKIAGDVEITNPTPDAIVVAIRTPTVRGGGEAAAAGAETAGEGAPA